MIEGLWNMEELGLSPDEAQVLPSSYLDYSDLKVK